MVAAENGNSGGNSHPADAGHRDQRDEQGGGSSQTNADGGPQHVATEDVVAVASPQAAAQPQPAATATQPNTRATSEPQPQPAATTEDRNRKRQFAT